jgi:tetratricopeptide (TPR) repeat protein
MNAGGAADESMSHVRRAAALLEARRYADAEAEARQAVAADPQQPLAHHILGDSLLHQARIAEAIEAYRQTIALDPRMPLTYTNLGVALHRAGQRDQAIEAYRAALAVDPDFSLALSNLGTALGERWELDEAQRCHRRAAELEPQSSVCATNLASVLGQLNRPDEQLIVARRAIALNPNNVKAHNSAALALLKLGRMEEGWAEFEWRTRIYGGDPSRRPWDGSPLQGRRIVLRAEQAFGDVIQIVRYAALVRDQRGGHVIVECQPLLKELLRRADGVAEVYAQGEAIPPAELEVWMMSLPHLLGTTSGTIPVNVPYLHPDPVTVERLRRLVGDESRLKLGLIWSGNPAHLNDRLRSCPLAMIQPLTRRTDVRCYSLQKGPAAERDAPIVADLGITDLASACEDFAESAAAMALMDLILTVDTAAAHLAGALARPTWTMLSGQADWRWMPADSDRSAWYPTMRLFRQKSASDWAGVIADVARAIDSLTLAGR